MDGDHLDSTIYDWLKVRTACQPLVGNETTRVKDGWYIYRTCAHSV